MSAAPNLFEDLVEEKFQRAGIPTRRRNGELEVQCSDATFDYVLKGGSPYVAPLLCTCPQREYPHELSIHSDLRGESYNPKLKFRWPWSLMLSKREEPSTERKVAA